MNRKYKCKTCEYVWFSEDVETECPLDEYPIEVHRIAEVKTITAKDYAEMWGNDLESANRHSLTDMPDIILSTMEKYVKDNKTIRKIMKDLYSKEVGI